MAQPKGKSEKWQAVFDEVAQEYYYWNETTNETTWTKPPELETAAASSKLKITKPANDGGKDESAPAPGEAAPNSDYYSSKEYYDWYMNAMAEAQIQQSATQTAASYAAAQKGDRFAELASLGITGVDNASQVSSKEYKQMSYFFDVEKYQQERALDRMQPKVVKKYTRKEVEKFKKKKHEKKVASLLQRMGPDA
ncbi:hypothetical protein HDV03_002201 [Kappamyces sp. JEL0829]|nr:hypothetical protein HDV03_002201 [Kappamyces sp. JEL0829]KAJ3365926.1 hypothetical protein HDU91_002025 [Kappamyces sp. JEL0680]